MGVFIYRAIAVSDMDDDGAFAALDKAIELGLKVTAMHVTGAYNVNTFFVVPDAQKEGSEPQEEYAAKRDEFVKWLERSGCTWAEVQYTDEYSGMTKVTRCSDPEDPRRWR